MLLGLLVLFTVGVSEPKYSDNVPPISMTAVIADADVHVVHCKHGYYIGSKDVRKSDFFDRREEAEMALKIYRQ